MNKTWTALAALGFVTLAAAGCKQKNDDAQVPAVPQAGQAAEPGPIQADGTERPALQSWVGRWTGPEGTWLDLSANGEGYLVQIRNLDGEASYEGRAAGDHIEFERNGTTESIRASDGAGTGMKWLAEKKDCLVIKSGEGYCRD